MRRQLILLPCSGETSRIDAEWQWQHGSPFRQLGTQTVYYNYDSSLLLDDYDDVLIVFASNIAPIRLCED